MTPTWWLVLALFVRGAAEPTTLSIPFETYGACRDALMGAEVWFNAELSLLQIRIP